MESGLRSYRTGRPLSNRAMLFNGVMAGCILWIKFNLLGFHLGWMAFLAIDALACDRSLRRPLRMCAWFLAGMALATVPWLIWFGAEGALGELFGVYFYGNIFGYAFGEDARRVSMLGEFLKAARQNPVFTVCMALGAASALLLPHRIMSVREKLLLAVGAAAMIPAIYGGGGSNKYYYMAFAVFVPYAMLAGALPGRLLPRMNAPAQCALALAMLAASFGWAYTSCPAARYIGWEKKDTAQGQVAAYMAGREGATLLNVGFLDGGFYYAAGAEPASRWFCQLNYGWRESSEEHAGLLKEGAADFAVFAREPDGTFDLSQYELVLEARSDYGKGCVSTAECYYLYEKKVTS